MNLTQLRQAVMTVVQQIVNDHTDYPLVVEADNRSVVDQATQVNPYLAVSVQPMGGNQADIGQNPNVKHQGQIHIAAVVKDGDGTADASALLDFVLPYFNTAQLGTAQCQAACEVKGFEKNGWWYQPAIVPYYYFATVR